MNRFDQLTLELLEKARGASEYLPVRVNELASQTGIDQRHIREKLAQLHENRLIQLSAWDEKEGREKPFDQWPSADFFFNYASDGSHKRIRLLVTGAEFLEDLAQTDASAAHGRIPSMPKGIQEIVVGIDGLRSELKEFLLK
jgi:predicted ArsR family transcriptional regulator